MSWPTDPHGSMVPILEASIAAHPSSKPPVTPSGAVVLTVADRCDNCGAEAAYRVTKQPKALPLVSATLTLDFCLHHWRKNFPPMIVQGWAVVGGNPDLLAAMAAEGDHNRGTPE